jgi:hypothetical protein
MGKYIYTDFSKFINESLIYNKINNLVDGEDIPFYQVPFSLFDNEECIIGYLPNTNDEYSMCFSDAFVYDYVMDSDIQKALSEDLSSVDITKDWTMAYNNDNKFRYESAYTDKEKHAIRIAKLVQTVKDGEMISPILMYFDDKAWTYDIKNYIEDGNHRIRALQYLNYTHFPAYINGDFRQYLIDYINNQ